MSTTIPPPTVPNLLTANGVASTPAPMAQFASVAVDPETFPRRFARPSVSPTSAELASALMALEIMCSSSLSACAASRASAVSVDIRVPSGQRSSTRPSELAFVRVLALYSLTPHALRQR